MPPTTRRATEATRDAEARARLREERAPLAERVGALMREKLPGCSEGLLRPDLANDDDVRLLEVLTREFAGDVDTPREPVHRGGGVVLASRRELVELLVKWIVVGVLVGMLAVWVRGGC